MSYLGDANWTDCRQSCAIQYLLFYKYGSGCVGKKNFLEGCRMSDLTVCFVARLSIGGTPCATAIILLSFETVANSF